MTQLLLLFFGFVWYAADAVRTALWFIYVPVMCILMLGAVIWMPMVLSAVMGFTAEGILATVGWVVHRVGS